MRLRPLLLHAVLCLALVANGISGAMASVHATCAHDAVAEASLAAEPPAAEPPCHENMDMAASNAHSGMQHDGMSVSSTQHDPLGSEQKGCDDCARHCQCACIAHGLAALMPSPLLLAAASGIAYTPAPSYAHATPALPHPVRPPIG
jgi:hypothetical protein